MNLLETILAAQNGGAVQQLGQQFGLGEEQTTAALSALVPALAAGFSRNVQQEGGLDSLAAALSGGRHSQYLDDPGTLQQADTVADGNGILGHIFGSKDVSRQVATRGRADAASSRSILKKMLPIVAAMVMGGRSRQASAPAAPRPAAGRRGGAAAICSACWRRCSTRNRDGSMVDDVAGMLGKFMGGR